MNRNAYSPIDEKTVTLPEVRYGQHPSNIRRLRQDVVDLCIIGVTLLTVGLYCLAWAKVLFWMVSW